MADRYIETKDTIDYELFKKIAKTKVTVHVGHLSGPEVDVAKKLYFGRYSPAYTSPRGNEMHGRNIPARPYLTDGMMFHEDAIMGGVQSFYKGLLVGKTDGVPEQIGKMLEISIQSFVETNPYGSTNPNAADVIADKGFNHPLQDTGRLMESLKSVVTK